MNLGDMIYSVRQGIQTMDAFTHNLFLDEQIIELLNTKIETFVKNQYLNNRVQLPNGSFEINKEGLTNIQTLLNEEDYTIEKNEDTTENLPDDYRYLISIEAFVDEIPLNSQVRVVSKEVLPELLRNPFKTTSSLSPLSTIQDNKITVYVKKRFILNNLYVSYIKKPKLFVIDLQDNNLESTSDLPEHTHQTIIDMVVQDILEKTGNPRYQQKVTENELNK